MSFCKTKMCDLRAKALFIVYKKLIWYNLVGLKTSMISTIHKIADRVLKTGIKKDNTTKENY